jgi:hypothetical protein
MIAAKRARDPNAFELVLVGQGVTSSDLLAAARQLRAVVDATFMHMDFSLFVDDSGPSLGLTPSPPVLTSTDSNGSGPINTYLAGLQLPGPRPPVPANRWAAGNGLVVALVPATAQPVDLYDVAGTIAKVAIVGASAPAGGSIDWTDLVCRAVGQLHFGLLDEYELPGSDWEKPPAAAAGGWGNVIFITDAQRTALMGAPTPTAMSVLGEALSGWPVTSTYKLTFVPHAGATGTVSNPAPDSGWKSILNIQELQLVEGAGGFRTNAVRSGLDCLMHRIPGDATLPVQGGARFCAVCDHIINHAVRHGDEGGIDRPVRLRSQRTEYDRYGPRGKVSTLTPPGDTTVQSAVTSDDVQWAVDVSATGGFHFSNLTAKGRPLDPFTNSNNLAKAIEYTNLSVVFADGSATQQLDLSAGVTAAGAALESYVGPVDDPNAAGVKLSCSWQLSNGWTIEGRFTLVLKHAANTIDPGGAVMGCKLFPQIALRAVRTPGHDGALPPIDHFTASIVLTLNNALDARDEQAMMDLGGQMAPGTSMAGQLVANLFTDTNGRGADANYSYGGTFPTSFWFPYTGSKAFPAEPTATYASGRRIAGIQTFATDVGALPVMAWLAHTGGLLVHQGSWVSWNFSGPPLGHWTWLFDYCIPDCVPTTGSPPVTFAAVLDENETTPVGNATAQRNVQLAWPPKSDFVDLAAGGVTPQLTAVKYPRQGAYDSIHVTPPMGLDDNGQAIIAAPFCGDMCVHMHFRWGADGVDNRLVSETARPRYLGWTTGRLAQAQVLLGTPLIPPNQHIDVTVERPADDEVKVTYAAKIATPAPGAWQVLLEQGLGMAFSYQGIEAVALAGAAATTLGPAPWNGVTAGDLTGTNGPKNRRKVFLAMYVRQRWYAAEDNVISPDPHVQQIPDLSSAADIAAIGKARAAVEGA